VFAAFAAVLSFLSFRRRRDSADPGEANRTHREADPEFHLAKKLQGSTSDQPDPKLQAEPEAVAKNSGFKDFAEYDNVAANILMVVAGIDPLTKRYTDPQTAVKKGIAKVTADKTIPDKDKKELIKEFEKVAESGAAHSISQQHRAGQEIL